MFIKDLYYIGKNLIWISNMSAQLIPAWIWGAYNAYKVAEVVYTNSYYLYNVSKRITHKTQEEEKCSIIIIKEDVEDDFIMID